MQNVLHMIGEFVAHEWRFFLIIVPIVAVGAYVAAFVITPLRVMRWLVRLWPLSARLHLELGRMLTDSDPAAAEAEMRQALTIDPETGEAYFLLADMLIDQKERLDDADLTVRQMLRRFPGHPAAYCLQGLIHQRRGDFKAAEKAYRAANAAAPEFSWPCTLLGELLKDKLDNPLGAEIAYRQAIRNQPNVPANYDQLGHLMMQAGRYAEAVKCYEVAAQKNRRDVVSRINLGLALAFANRTAEAAKLVPHIMRTQPRLAPAEVGLGRLLRRLDRREEAEAAFRRAIAKDSKTVDAYAELGKLLDEDPCTMAEAEQIYRQGLEVDFADHELNYDIALLLRRVQRHEEALPFLRQAIAADGEDFESYVGIAAVFKRCGDSEHFVEAVELARQRVPSDDDYAVACLEAVCDQPDLALEHLSRAAQARDFSRWWAWNDPDLEPLRSDPRFAQLLGPCPESAVAPAAAEA